MKPFWGINISDGKNKTINGREFITAQISDELNKELAEASENVNTAKEKANMSKPLSVVKFIAGFFAFVSFLVLAIKLLQGEPDEVYNSMWWLFWAFAAMLVLWMALSLLKLKKEKDLIADDNLQDKNRQLRHVNIKISKELDIPYNAENADIMVFNYRSSTGEIEPGETMKIPYVCVDVKVFTENNNLNLFATDGIYSIPIKEIKRIRTVDKRISIIGWNKNVSPMEGKYQQYNIKMGESGIMSFKTYHILEFVHNKTTWGLLFPCYDVDIFETLTGLHAEE